MGLLDGGMQGIFGAAFGSVYLSGYLIRVTLTDDGEGGYSGATYAVHAIKGQVDAATERMRRAESYTDEDMRVLILQSGVAIEPNSDDIAILGGKVWSLDGILADPANTHWEMTGRSGTMPLPTVSFTSPTGDNTPEISGTGLAGASIDVSYSGTVVTGFAIVGSDGTWSGSLPELADGSFAIRARQTISGVTSEWVDGGNLAVDTAPPLVPTITTPSPLLTSDATPTIAGTMGPAAATVTIYLDGIAAGSATLGSGTWSFTFDALVLGMYEVTATTTDAVGNESAPSQPLEMTVGLIVPTGDTITTLALEMLEVQLGGPYTNGPVVINGQSLGDLDYFVKQGPTVVSAFNEADWFTATADSRSAWIAHRGDLTINAGQVFRPSARKLFTVLIVDGDLIVNGEISMTRRGANHSATGSNIAAAAIKIYDGEADGVTNPSVPAEGSAGGASPSTTGHGTPGSAGTGGQTGGGGSGANAAGGAGAAGTAFGGGSGGGGRRDLPGQAGAANGGKGGDGGSSSGTAGGGGGGNPGGDTYANSAPVPNAAAQSGTGGTLIVIVTGELRGSGTITAAGASGYPSSSISNVEGGGGSGGGSVTVLCSADASSVTVSALGGPGGDSNLRDGGKGGDGTARVLEGLAA